MFRIRVAILQSMSNLTPEVERDAHPHLNHPSLQLMLLQYGVEVIVRVHMAVIRGDLLLARAPYRAVFGPRQRHLRRVHFPILLQTSLLRLAPSRIYSRTVSI